MVTTAAVLALALAAPGGSWDDHYLRGVKLVQEGHGAEARAELQRAFEVRPVAALAVSAGGRTLDYLPQLYLAMACQMSGDVERAREYLALADKDGKAAQSSEGRPLLEAYRGLLAPSAEAAPRYRKFERKPVVLPEARYRELQGAVLNRCQLPPDSDAARAPWYFHYQLGERLMTEGDPQRALDSFIEAATRRAEPQRDARTYGMWFTQYIPYFQIARAHARLQNWDCAKDALAVSTRTREISERDREFAEFRALLVETEKKAGH